MAAEKGWDNREVGWDISEAHVKAVLALYKEGNIPLLIQECSDQCSLRPKDPYILLAYDALQAMSDQKNLPRLMRLAEDSRNALTLIPQNNVYSKYRLQCMVQAAAIATAGREAEKRNGPTPRSSAASRRSLELWSDVLRFEPSDPTGYNRFYHAVAKLDDGDISGARSEAKTVIQMLKNDPDCLYGYACILSMDKDYDNALQILQAALVTGSIDLSDVRTDPDLLPLASERRDQFQKLTIPQWSWTVTNDWLNDDVILQNESLYPLTNVEFSVVLKKGEKAQTLSLKCDKIAAGASQKWTDAVKAPGGAWESSSTAKLSCDQASK